MKVGGVLSPDTIWILSIAADGGIGLEVDGLFAHIKTSLRVTAVGDCGICPVAVLHSAPGSIVIASI